MAARNDFYVYVLFDWQGIPRYVGKGRGRRIDQHEEPGRKGNRIKKAFIRKTLAILGDVPKIKVREDLTEPEAFETEIALIKAIGRIDIKTGPLANMSDGGTGGDYGHLIKKAKAAWTPEQRAAFSETYRQSTTAWQAALPEDEKKKRTERTVVAMQAGRKAKALSDPGFEQRRADNISAGHAARTPEQKAEASRKRLETFPPEMQSAAIKRFHDSQTPEERRIRVNGSQTAEQRSERGRKAAAARTPEQRSESARLGQTRCGPAVKEGQRRRGAALGAGKRWITNGMKCRRIGPEEVVPTGWRYGKKLDKERDIEGQLSLPF